MNAAIKSGALRACCWAFASLVSLCWVWASGRDVAPFWSFWFAAGLSVATAGLAAESSHRARVWFPILVSTIVVLLALESGAMLL